LDFELQSNHLFSTPERNHCAETEKGTMSNERNLKATCEHESNHNYYSEDEAERFLNEVMSSNRIEKEIIEIM
jgi:hypothetical protein